MQPRVDATFDASLATSPNRPRTHWLLTAEGLFYFAIMAVGINRTLPTFTTLFADVGVHVPWPTRVLLSSTSWLLPAAFAVGALLIVAKTSVGFSRPQRRVVNYAIIFIGAVLPAAIFFLLSLPLVVLIAKGIGPR
jgi:hypothetical protein